MVKKGVGGGTIKSEAVEHNPHSSVEFAEERRRGGGH